jgi:hypothetical protein
MEQHEIETHIKKIACPELTTDIAKHERRIARLDVARKKVKRP